MAPEAVLRCEMTSPVRRADSQSFHQVFVHVEQHVEEHELRDWKDNTHTNAGHGVRDAERDVKLKFSDAHLESDVEKMDNEKSG
jgi:hypothetical protein